MAKNTITSNVKKFPVKPITMIIPFSAGSGIDLVARSLGKKAQQYLSQPLVIINKPGAAGTLGWNEVAAAIPDGYTVSIASPDVALQTIYGVSKYDYIVALEPIAQIAAFPLVLTASKAQPWENAIDLINYAKQHPGQIKYGHWGVGSLGHVLGEIFAYNAGIKITHVPFQGGGEMMAALLGGHIELMVANPVLVKEHVKNGSVKALAVTSEHRLNDPEFANVPTLKELGLDVAYDNWEMVCVPKDLPPNVKTKLVAGFKGVITDPDFQTEMMNMGVKVNYLGPDEALKVWLDDKDKYSKAVQETGILNSIKEQKK